MPSAGAVVPPVIVALKRSQPGHPNTHIDTSTFIQLETETPHCKLYFSTNGERPNPFQLKVGGREVTFRYRGPFTLKPGKRLVKAIAIARDGLQESNVTSKQFIVDDVGGPNEDDIEFIESDLDTRRSVTNGTGSHRVKKPIPTRSSTTFARSKRLQPSASARPRSAWGSRDVTSTDDDIPQQPQPVVNVVTTPQKAQPNYWDYGQAHGGYPEPDASNGGPTNYSGTQVNMYGVHPAIVPSLLAGGNMNPAAFMAGGGGITYPDKHKQLGYMTDHMIKSMEDPKLTVADVKRLLEEQKAPPPQPQVQAPPPPPAEPQLNEESPGNGDWKGNIEHIYAHLLDRAKKNAPFRNAVGQPKIGFIVDSECVDDEGNLNLNVTFTFRGPAVQKPKPKKKVEAKPVMAKKKPTPPPTPPPPKLEEPPKPKEKPKKKPNPTKPPPPPPEEPFFKTEEYEQEGTLKEWEFFDTELDCEALRKAMKGLGTDETAITNIMGYRCCTQRMENNKMFKTMFGKNLREELMGETSGNYKELLGALCMGAADYDASEIHRAVAGLGTNEDVLIEVLCTRTNVQIKAIREAYSKLYPKKDMVKDVKDDTSGYFRKLLEFQMNGNRPETKEYDLTAAKQDAQALYNAGEKQWGTDESQFNNILCSRSFAHLRAVFDEYDKLSKKTIEKAIESEFSGDIKDSLLTLVGVIRDKPLYFARLMGKAMKGLGTDDSALIRVVVSRCECDMVQIMQAFEREYKAPLAQWIKDDCSGDYSELLLALIGARPPPAPTADEVEAAEEPKEIEEMEEEKLEETPSVVDASPFDPKKDCEVLKKAMKGFGTDEDAIINVWPRRSNKQRQEIIAMYRTMYNKDLIKELVSEISGNFEDVIVALGQKSADYDANELRRAMKGLGTDEDCLIEILCTRNNAEMAALQEAYTRIHKRKLEDDIISETSGNLKRLLVSMVQANRPEGNMIDRAKARKDAKALLEAGEEKFGTDESRFNVILCSRSFAHLRAMFQEYAKISEKDIEDVIKSEMSGDIKKGMLTVVRCVKNKQQQFAKRLHDAMSGLGTDDASLIRVCVSRSEIDMVQIKQQFQQMYDQPLGQFIKDDISGDYRKTMLILVGEETFMKK